MTASAYRHPGEATRTCPPDQCQQYGLGLVVASVPEQHSGGTVLTGRASQCLVTGIAGSRLRTTGTVSGIDGGHDDWRESLTAGPFSHRAGTLRGAGLQLVIDRNQSDVGQHEPGRSGECG